MSLQSSGGVIGNPAENVAPVSGARASDAAQGSSHVTFWQSSVFGWVLMNWVRQGSIVLGVNSCSSLSPAQIRPPPLPRTSMMSPSRGICGSSISRRNSLTNATSSPDREGEDPDIGIVASAGVDDPGLEYVGHR